MNKFPRVLSEYETVTRAMLGASLARFGDGEIRLAAGIPAKQCKTQCHNEQMRDELRTMLAKPTHALVCLPNLDPYLPGYDQHWKRFEHHKWHDMMLQPREYGSSFITRPDQAPHIRNAAFMDMVTSLWQGRDVVLVIGVPQEGKRYGLTPELLAGQVSSVEVIEGPHHDAYVDIDRIDRAIGTPTGKLVLLCLGATATCLAERVARRGVQALDLGHYGKLMLNGGERNYE